MSKHGYKHVRKINDGRPKPYLGRITIKGEQYQTKCCATPQEAANAAEEKKKYIAAVAAQTTG